MNNIPPALKRDMALDPFYEQCARRADGRCSGRITWEHAYTYAGKQIQERWAIIPLCFHHHLGPGLDKAKNRRIALARAMKWELAKYPRLTASRHQVN